MPHKTLPVIALTAAAATLPMQAQARDNAKFEPEGGAYVSVLAGVTLPSDSDFDGVQAPVAPSPGTAGAPAVVEVGFESDFTGSIAAGYRLPRAFLGIFQPSIEIEYSRTTPGVESGAFNGGNQTFSGGFDIDSYTIGYQSDIRWKNDQKIIPFLGGGIGIADVNANAAYFPNNGVATAPTFAVRDSDTGLSLHSNIGATYVLNDNFDLHGRVRYQRITELEFDRRFIAGGNDAFNAELDGSFETVSLLAGVRYRF